MRTTVMVILLGTGMWAQTLVEGAAAAGGGSVGGMAGKKLSDGLSTIFNKVDKQTKAAASDKVKSANAPVFEVGPGVPHAAAPSSTVAVSKAEPGSVPPPPPPPRRAARRPARVEEPVLPPAPPPIAPVPPPPPPEATAEDLKMLTVGTRRDDVLKLGAPAARITMYDQGHLLEIFRYMNRDTSIGVVRLSDGSVASVQVN